VHSLEGVAAVLVRGVTCSLSLGEGGAAAEGAWLTDGDEHPGLDSASFSVKKTAIY
jgi:hypothetical protein